MRHETTAAREAYSQHDGGTVPKDIVDDVSAEHLADLC